MREILYKIILKQPRRAPSVVMDYHPSGKGLAVETLVCNLDDEGNVWRIVNVMGRPDVLAEVAEGFLRDTRFVDRRILEHSRLRLVLYIKYKQGALQGRPSLTHLTYSMLGREAAITDWTEGESLVIRILHARTRASAKFLRRLSAVASIHHEFTLLHVGPPRTRRLGMLTSDDQEAILAARRIGFFDVPRAGSMKALAAELQCSASTASYRLRRALARLIESYYGTPR